MNMLDPSLRDNLANAAERLASEQVGRRRRRRIALGATVATLAIAGGATAATGLWTDSIGDDQRGRSPVAADGPPAEQIERFAVLRRDAEPADRSPEVRRALKYLDPDYQGVRVEYVRSLSGDPANPGPILLPVTDWRKGPIRDALCLYSPEPRGNDGGGVSCWSLEQILRGDAVLLSRTEAKPTGARLEALKKCAAAARHKVQKNTVCQAPPAPPGLVTYRGLVPDGVASVRIGDEPGAPSVEVHNNSFALTTTGGGPATVRWLKADGSEAPR
ncbi:hypothetical protein [Patulibacter medicamentivorans]|uniref:hypothetical protein n=1 Tax=Patulibacter medicamentivorans TaxID=1097667 RepID=UPI0002E9B6D7|nr:hypothetical protein [Patulibacter medicamentivorans]